MTSTPAPQRHPIWHHRARHALAHSLRVRMVTLFVLLALAMAATFLFGMQYALGMGWRDAAKPLVMDYVSKLADEIGSPPSIARAQAIVQRLPLSVRISGPVVNWRSNAVEGDDEKHGRDLHANETRWGSERPRFFERTTVDGHHIRFGVSVQAWSDRPRFIGWATLAVLLALITLAYVRVRRMLRPLDDIRAGALRFGAGDFVQAIPVRHAHRPDELGELAATINTMGRDIHHMLEAKRALLLAISHELRSPLTRARLNTELLPETADVQPSRDALLRDLAVMRDLVTDLLESERLASPHAALHREPTNMAVLVADVVAQMARNATPGQAAVRQDCAADMPLLPLDATRMRLLVRNLLDNALRHSTGVAQPPRIALECSADAWRLTVRDWGVGVDPAQLAQLGQPFFRPDAARTREGGGVGLGLYLCRLVAQAHGGTLRVHNAHPGLEVQVQFPLDIRQS